MCQSLGRKIFGPTIAGGLLLLRRWTIIQNFGKSRKMCQSLGDDCTKFVSHTYI